MFDIPPIPSFDALHPGVSHFPVALLLVAPLFLLLALWVRERRQTLAVVALGLMVAGTAGVFVAASTGDAARDAAKLTPEQKRACETHESLGSTTRAVFTGLSLVLAALLLAPRALKMRSGTRFLSAGLLAVLVLSVAAGLIVVNTARTGGLLVHQQGVHARIR
jgi:uncharacterized membrane protein